MLKAIEIDGERIPVRQIIELEMYNGEVTIEIQHGRDTIKKERVFDEVRFVDSSTENGAWNTGEEPKEAGKYLVTVNGMFMNDDGTFTRDVLRADRVEYNPGDWKWEKIDGSFFRDDEKIIAWQKVPEPYKE